ncbi:MAG: hypothetical protein K2I03_11715 [Lachnospiraceae bacterium]|nr:hypothetical protein [Lachnospiraceae bacterium]MDE6232756.1 hypothetical protein [Lachnospiraceae bacterium]MDE6253931.1 hypothetical protein [Lachnospiraceae bacterium]
MKKKIASVVLLLTMSVSLVACGSNDKAQKSEAKVKEADISASEVMAKMSDSSESVEGVDASVSINFDADITVGDEKKKVAVKGDMDVKSNADPVEAYVNADMSIKADKESSDIKYEVYMVAEDDMCKVYFGNDTDGWMSTERSLDELGLGNIDDFTGDMDEIKEYYTEENIDSYFENVKVTEKKIDGKTCYSVKGDIAKDLLDTAIDSLSALAGSTVDIPDVKISLEVCTDKETGSPVELNIKADVAENDMIKVSACELSFKYNGNGKQDITVPDEALDAPDISGLGLY